MADALAYLVWRQAHEDFLEAMVRLGVLTREQEDGVTFRQVLPKMMPCQMVLNEATWEAIASWQQRPHRELDPVDPEFYEAVAEQFALYYGRGDASVIAMKELAKGHVNKPMVRPDRDKVCVGSY